MTPSKTAQTHPEPIQSVGDDDAAGASLQLDQPTNDATEEPVFGGAMRSGAGLTLGEGLTLGSSPDATPPESDGTRRTHPSVVDVQSAVNAVQGQDEDARAAAADFLRHAQSVEPKHPLVAVGLGMLAVQMRDYNAAMAQFERAYKNEPRMAAPLMNMGIIHRMYGRRAEAEQAFKQAIRQQPDLPEAHYNLSVVQDESGNLAAARESLERALLFRPSYGEAHNNLGLVLLRQGLVEKAVGHFRQALVWQPQLEAARTNLILGLYRLGRAAEAQSEVDRAMAEHRDINAVLRVQATGLAQLGHLDDAEAVGRRVLEATPGAFDVDIALGQVMLQRGDYEAAMAHYRTMLQQRRAPPVLLLAAMAQAQWAQGNFSQAREQYQQAMMLDHGQKDLTTQVTLGMARTLIDSGDVRQGVEALRKVVRDAPDSAEFGSALLHALRLDRPVDNAAQAKAHEDWWQRHQRPPKTPAVAAALRDDRPLRVGLLVGDVEAPHSAQLLRVWAQAGPTGKVTLFVYHNAPAGPVAKALQDKVAHWRAALPLGNADLAEQMRADSLDVLIDCCGHGPDGRMQSLSERAAPWILAWGPDAQSAVRAMPQPWGAVRTQPSERGSATAFAAQDLTLPGMVAWCPPSVDANCAEADRASPTAPTLAVCAPLSHLHRELLDAVARVMAEQPSARLHLLTDIAAADMPTTERLRRQLVVREIEPERVTVVPRRPVQDHQAHLNDLAACDVLLDAWPQSSATNVLDALWCGLPVVSLRGAGPHAEESAAVLDVLGLGHSACEGVEAYVARTSALLTADALKTSRTAQQRQALRTAVLAAVFAQPAQFVDQVETALLAHWQARTAEVANAQGQSEPSA